MNNPIPRKPRIIDNDMDLPIPELGGLGDEVLDIPIIKNIADDSEGAPGGSGVDGVGDCGGFFCRLLAYFVGFEILDGEGDTRASMSATMTFAPSLAKSRAASAPMPCPEPVIMATLPARRPAG